MVARTTLPPVTPAVVRRQVALDELDLHPDGSLAVVARRRVRGRAYVRDLLLVPMSGKGQRRIVRRGGEGPAQAQFSPDGRHLAFLAERPASGGAGDEPTAQVWILALARGEAWPLTAAPHGVSGFAWSPDGGRIAFWGWQGPPRFLVGPPGGSEAPTARRITSGDWRMDETGLPGVPHPPQRDRRPPPRPRRGRDRRGLRRRGACLGRRWALARLLRRPRPDMGHWGGPDAEDVLAVIDALVADGSVDARRVGLLGLSYSAFLVNWLVGADPDRWAAAVSEDGVTNQVMGWSGSDTGPDYDRRADLGEPFDEAGVARLWRQSPLRHVAAIRTPLLLLQGEADLRCPAADNQALFLALRAFGRPVELVLYPDSWHVFAAAGRPDRRIDRHTRMLAWFQRYMPASAGAST